MLPCVGAKQADALLRRLAVLALLFTATPALAQPSTPGGLPGRFIAAWNAHDPKAFESLYAPDATWVPVAEERTEGRTAIVSEFAKIHTGNGWAARSELAMKGVPVIHMIRPDVATVFFHMDFIVDGKPAPGLQRALILVATRSAGDWRIAAGQLTKESGGAAK